jgi:ABC-type uncharacterized transport system permease subunit
MTETVFLLKVLLPFAYCFTTVCYFLDFFRSENGANWFSKTKRYALLATATLHLIYLAALTIHNAVPPVASLFQVMTMIAFTLTVTYLFIEFSTQITGTGSFVLSVAALFQLVSSFLISESFAASAATESAVLQLHIITALLGYSAIAVAGIYSLLYLLLFRQIQSNQYGIFFERLPGLEVFESMSYKAVVLGFVSLTLAFIAGALGVPKSVMFSFSDPKLIGLIAVWAIYGAGMLWRKQLGLYGKRMAVMLISGFLFAFLSMTALNFFSSRFHTAY